MSNLLQSHSEGSSLRGISRIGKRSYGTVTSLVSTASQKTQMIHKVHDSGLILTGRVGKHTNAFIEELVGSH